MMFKQDFKAQVSKHLNVFQQAAEGLTKVRQAMQVEKMRLIGAKARLALDIKEAEQAIADLETHHTAVGDTLSKINVLLPTPQKVQ
jgi:hypothetical protein